MKELGEEDDDSVVTTVKVPKKTPGKLRNNFEDIARQREERDQKKLELERKMRFSSELRAVKERKNEQEVRSRDQYQPLCAALSTIVTSQDLLPRRGNSYSIYWIIGISKFVFCIFYWWHAKLTFTQIMLSFCWLQFSVKKKKTIISINQL